LAIVVTSQQDKQDNHLLANQQTVVIALPRPSEFSISIIRARILKGWAALIATATVLTTLGGAYTLVAFDLRGRDPIMTVGAEVVPDGFWIGFGSADQKSISGLQASFAAYDAKGSFVRSDYFTPNPMSIAGNGLKEAVLPPDQVEMAGSIRFCGIHDGPYLLDSLMDVWYLAPSKNDAKRWGQVGQKQSRWIFASPDCTPPSELPSETKASLGLPQ
jgi:hypothetical protein